MGSIPGRGTKIPHAVQRSPKKKKKDIQSRKLLSYRLDQLSHWCPCSPWFPPVAGIFTFKYELQRVTLLLKILKWLSI